MDVYIDPRAHRCPPVIASAASPSDPRGCPFVPWYPSPPVVVVPIPPSVVERGPTPRVIRHPHVAVVGHHPVAVSGVGMKIPAHAGNPYATVRTIVDPPTVRAQLVVEHVEINASLIVILSLVVAVIVVSLRIDVIPRRAAGPKG